MLTISPESMAALSQGKSEVDALAGWLAANGGPVPATRVEAEQWRADGLELARSFDLLPEIEVEEERFYLAALAVRLLAPRMEGRIWLQVGDLLTSPAPVAQRVAGLRALAA